VWKDASARMTILGRPPATESSARADGAAGLRRATCRPARAAPARARPEWPRAGGLDRVANAAARRVRRGTARRSSGRRPWRDRVGPASRARIHAAASAPSTCGAAGPPRARARHACAQPLGHGRANVGQEAQPVVGVGRVDRVAVAAATLATWSGAPNGGGTSDHRSANAGRASAGPNPRCPAGSGTGRTAG
jgi:hypothetical protein